MPHEVCNVHSPVLQMDTSPLAHVEITAVIETRRARFVLICFCHSVFLGISSPGLIYTSPCRLNFSENDQNSIFICQVFYLTFRYHQAHGFLWSTKFQSRQVNPKSCLPNLATKVCGSVCSRDIGKVTWSVSIIPFNTVLE